MTNEAGNLHVDVCMVPHPAKRAKGGEDAFFVSMDASAIGVADGVGSWSFHGIDPGLYSKALMQSVKKSWDEKGLRDLHLIIKTANEEVSHITGSSTISILFFDKSDGKVHAANLGDSGFLVVRDGKAWYRTKEQLHSFNFPFQMGTGQHESANDAEMIHLDTQPGDVIILATDGLWDNLSDDEIVKIVVDYMHSNGGHSEANTLADQLALRAFARAGSMEEVSPFMRHAFEHGFVAAPTGGKMDDITVVVGVVPRKNFPSESVPNVEPM